ncbi:transglycosylase SLT domain-containing protein [Burkholderia ambifaria]|uniref:transglycosylase SLT domain-containing protein n=1 Tax=Burkholderia ambifaria TaxID=152480 RepID=UPI000F80EC2E|nr:transglycosylase SLT domain-containing protein [Burkholderia ambifaria]
MAQHRLHRPARTLVTHLLSGLALGAMLALAISSRSANVPVNPLQTVAQVFFRATTAAPRAVTVQAVDRHIWREQVSGYLETRWNLASGYAVTVAGAVEHAARAYQLDPMVLLAIAATESSFRHDVGNPGGGADPMEPYGIMQVAGRWHRDKFPNGTVVRTGVAENIHIGASVLRDYLDLEDGNLRRALMRYNGTSDDRYSQKVAALSRRLRAELATLPA